MSNKRDELKLDKQKDFTTSALVDYLNKEYGSKKTGEKFKLGDVQQYLRRGFLPKNYGNHPISRIEDTDIGIKLIRVELDKTVK
jgi:hypothetical protein